MKPRSRVGDGYQRVLKFQLCSTESGEYLCVSVPRILGGAGRYGETRLLSSEKQRWYDRAYDLCVCGFPAHEYAGYSAELAEMEAGFKAQGSVGIIPVGSAGDND